MLNPTPASYIDNNEHILAAHIHGENDGDIKVIFIADMDFVSDLYYEQISEDGLGQKLDNVSFLQNAIEVLAGEEAFVALRNRRPSPRTLDYIERQTEEFRKTALKLRKPLKKGFVMSCKKNRTNWTPKRQKSKATNR